MPLIRGRIPGLLTILLGSVALAGCSGGQPTSQPTSARVPQLFAGTLKVKEEDPRQ